MGESLINWRLKFKRPKPRLLAKTPMKNILKLMRKELSQMKVLKIMIGFLIAMLLVSCQTFSASKLPEALNRKCPPIAIKTGKAMPQVIDLAVAYAHCRTNNNALIELLEPD